LSDGNAIPMPDKTFDILLTLIEHRDKVISRNDLMSLVWHAVVEENNLDQHISKLREVFNDKRPFKNRHIKTFPREGYQFVAEVRERSESNRTVPEPSLIETSEEHAVAEPVEETDTSTISGATYVPREKANKVKRARWWLGLGLGVAVLIASMFVGSRLVRKPEISAIIPATPLATIGDQSIVLMGHNFQKGSTVKVTFPSGGSAILNGKQINPRSETSFVILADLNGTWGEYTLEVNTPYGRSSAPFHFKALKHIQSPVIEAVMPESPEATMEEQRVVVYGHNFQSAVVIEVIFPNGGTAVLQARQISERMPTALTMLIYFDGRPGVYSIRARNPNGDWSPPFTFTVH